MDTGKKASLEHRRHVVDPTLLGLHEVRGRLGCGCVRHAASEAAHRLHAGVSVAAGAVLWLCALQGSCTALQVCCSSPGAHRPAQPCPCSAPHR